jgi:hypothetical protein
MGPPRAERERWNNLGKDVVVLHQFARGKTIPSPSPFVLKLETFLRVADIKYENDHKYFKSAKGKTPWMTVNGEHVADSQFAIEHLRKIKNLNEILTAQEQGRKIVLDKLERDPAS